MTNIYLTKHRRLFAEPEPKRRMWLLWLRWWYGWQESLYLRQCAVCVRKRMEVLEQLSRDDEDNENGVR
jgi:hypothetical protein